MGIMIRRYEETDREALRGLLTHPSIAPQFDKFQGPDGLDHKLSDRKLSRESIRLAFVDGVPAGFGVAWVLEQSGSIWTMTRVGVLESHRRLGVGRRLAEAVIDGVREAASAGAPVEVAGAAWMPNEAAIALASRLGFVHERWFWLMERPRGAVTAPAWPMGMTLREYDGSAAMRQDWTDVYNDAFANHYRFSPTSTEDADRLVADRAFRRDGLLLVYRQLECVGFCRIELHETRGEIGTLGTAHSARGLGLGRALLRWGVAWLEANTTTPVTLIVDGANDGALGLYRSEGFEVSRSREIWGRKFDPRVSA